MDPRSTVVDRHATAANPAANRLEWGLLLGVVLTPALLAFGWVLAPTVVPLAPAVVLARTAPSRTSARARSASEIHRLLE